MKRILHKAVFREIRDSFSRYLSIVGIIMLGSGVFTGLNVTTPAMLETINRYVEETAFFDYRLVSTLGWDKERENVFGTCENIEAAEGSLSTDFLAPYGDSEIVLKAHTLTSILNTPQLVSGRMPEHGNECLVDSYALGSFKLGDIIRVSDANDEDTLDMFTYREYTVVGTARTPLYINFERGNTTLGNGIVSAFVLLPPEGFSTDYYTEYYLRLKDAGYVYSDAYEDVVDRHIDAVTDEAKAEAQQRYMRIRHDAQAELNDAKEDYEEGRRDYLEGLNSYRDGLLEYEDGRADVAEARRTLINTFYNTRNELLDKETTLEQKRDEAQAARLTLTDALSQMEPNIPAAQQAAASLPAVLAGLDPASAEYAAYSEQLAQAQGLLEQYSQAQNALAVIDSSLAQISDGLAQIVSGKKTLYENYYAAEKKILESEAELDDAEEERKDAKVELVDAEAELDDAWQEISDAQREIDELEEPGTFVLTRESNVAYVCFENEANIVAGIAHLFPFFFFAVAALVCITTMNRMVTSERGQIGILKALGYSVQDIAKRYLFYSGSASLLGCAIGVIAGSIIFPSVIWQAYLIMYSMGPIHLVFDVRFMLLSSISYLLLALAVTWFSCRSELRLSAAELLRPKSPPPGKRILLERIGFIWKRLKFLHKISLRNVFRYQQRFIMMVLGIGGCTALLLTGLGLDDSITDIANKQFEQISIYDGSVFFSEDMSGREDRFLAQCGNAVTDCAFLYSANWDCQTESAIVRVTVCAVKDFAELDGLMNFHRGDLPVAAPKEGECIISDSLLNRYSLDVGDTVHLTSGNNESIDLRVAGVFENVIYNYVYASLSTVQQELDKTPLKAAYINLAPSRDVHEAGRIVSAADNVSSLLLCQDMLQRVNSMLSSMKYIVGLIIACAAALAFVVLFNLSNINIQERIREIATIKVLGFKSGETGQYVFRENIILTFCGCILGIPLGIWLHNGVISCIRIDMISFVATRRPLSYLLSVALTFSFTVIVNFIMRPKLEKINMAEALKSVE